MSVVRPLCVIVGINEHCVTELLPSSSLTMVTLANPPTRHSFSTIVLMKLPTDQ